MEDKLNGRQLPWNTTSMEDHLNGGQPQRKTISIDDNLNGRQLQWKTPQWKTTTMIRFKFLR